MTNHLSSSLKAIFLSLSLCLIFTACGESAQEEARRRAIAIEDSIRKQDDREARMLLDSLAAADDTTQTDSVQAP